MLNGLQNKQNAAANEPWIRIPILLQNKKIGPLYSWTRESQRNKLFIGEKFSQPVDVVIPTKEEYAEANKERWELEEYRYLCELLSLYNMNFIVVQDRYEFAGRSRTIEELKEVT